MKVYDTIIIGGGQAGLSLAYFMRRHSFDYLILDDQDSPGGSWLQTWDSLKLFSPVQYSSLSGWMMPRGQAEYPGKDEFLNYLQAYEERYNFPIKRPVRVKHVTKKDGLFVLETNDGLLHSKTLISATGSAQNPYTPTYPKQDAFEGIQIHSSQYENSDAFEGKKVLVVGGGNSGAQILAEVSKVADTQWVTLDPPNFLPDDIDGRYLFSAATRKFLNPGSVEEGTFSLGDIVMLESVKEARGRGVLTARRPFKAFYEKGVLWNDSDAEAYDAVIWCTGFKANLRHLDGLGIQSNGRIATRYTRSIKEPNLWLVGYGSWTGFASATIYGVGKTARDTAKEVVTSLS